MTDTQTFETRIEKHQPLLISIVNSIHKRLPPFILYDDVLGYGQLGLAQASRTYQPQPKAKFSTYAYYRISGAIYDGIGRMNWSTRAEYRRYRARQQANDYLEETDKKRLENNPEEQAKWLDDSVRSLSTIYMFSGLDNEKPFESQIAGSDNEPAEEAETSELVLLLRLAVKQLPSDERSLIEMVYFEDMPLAEAARKLGKSRSWASRLHARVLKDLGKQLV